MKSDLLRMLSAPQRHYWAVYGLAPIMGSDAPEDDTDDEDDGTPEDRADTDPEDSHESRDRAADDDGDLPKAARRYKVRMQAADRRAAKAETERDQLAEELTAARVELALRKEMAERAEAFVEPELAIELAREHVAVKDGQPTKVAEALDFLADRHPYLLAKEHGQPETKVQPERSGGGASGTHANRQKPLVGRRTGFTDKQLRAKYRALQRR